MYRRRGERGFRAFEVWGLGALREMNPTDYGTRRAQGMGSYDIVLDWSTRF